MSSSYDGDGGPVDNASQWNEGEIVPQLTEPPTPQHDKAKPYKQEMQSIGEFIEWLSDTKGLVVCDRTWTGGYEWSGERHMVWMPAGAMGKIQEWLAEFYSIDYKAYLAEKDAVLEYVRALQGIK